jgi:dTMP kinase
MPPADRGRLLAVCGTDGTGKTTQTRLLVQWARETGLPVETMSFPRYEEGFFGGLIRRYLQGEMAGRAGEVDPYLAALPYACDRWEAAPQLREWLAEGCLVVCNRYVPANMAHQGAKIREEEERARFYRWAVELEYDVFGLPRPDPHLLMDLPTDLSARLLSGREADERPEGGSDIHERDTEYLRATAEAYREIARTMPGRWVVVECAEEGRLLSPEAIAEQVRAAVTRLMQDTG